MTEYITKELIDKTLKYMGQPIIKNMADPLMLSTVIYALEKLKESVE